MTAPISPHRVADLMAASSSILYEPSISLRIGHDPLKLTLDLARSDNQTHPDLRMDHSVTARNTIGCAHRQQVG